MTEKIGETLADLMTDIVPLYYSEAETEEYPYAVYAMEVSPVLTKEGVHKLSATLAIEIVSTDYDEADEIAGQILDAIETGMNDGSVFLSSLQQTRTTRTEGIWILRLDYNVYQFDQINS